MSRFTKASQKIVLGAVAALSLMTSTSAFADHNERERERYDSEATYIHRNFDHRDEGFRNYNYQMNVGRPEIIKIYDNDRIILSQYVEDRYRASYQDNWHRGHHGHGHGYNDYRHYRQPIERQYIVGYPLPYDVTYYSVPYEVRSHLRPTPIGYQYIRVDDDVLLINSATKNVIDAVTLFSAQR